ncbi:MAG: hypothetical protein DRI57_23885 [Deltaproteobacteria bacterium]|nr:MAG: hypothetical protein DRI57_23885 [Deltaproteobacteria bacterium]
MIELNFRECTLDLLDNKFGLRQIRNCACLDEWMAMPADGSDWEEKVIAHLRELLTENVHDWNESELSQNFIGPVFALVNFTDDRFNLFAEREIGGVVNEIQMSGHPDGMVASGRRSPTRPYFCFQEYKRERDPRGDPAGQCLAAMLVAQEINKHEHPVYGCHVVGELWRFMTLQGNEYCISQSFTATGEDVSEIFRILKALKQIIICDLGLSFTNQVYATLHMLPSSQDHQGLL